MVGNITKTNNLIGLAIKKPAIVKALLCFRPTVAGFLITNF